MLRIRVNELSQPDRERLRAELRQILLTELTYPAFIDYRAGDLRARPTSREDRLRVEGFAAALRLDDQETADINSSGLAEYLTDALLRYYRTTLAGRQPTRAAPLVAARLVGDVQRRLVAYVLDGAPNGFGDVDAANSWKTNHPSVPLSAPWEAIASGTLALASALAQWREEPPPAPPRRIVPSVSDTATAVLPAVERANLPEPLAANHLLTAPLPRTVEVPTPPPAAANRNDQAIFTQLRQQLLAAMATAARSYGLTTTPTDPAGLLAALRRIDAIDEGDLRLAEGMLALCGNVIAASRANLDDYRQALTLYLLFNRSRFARG